MLINTDKLKIASSMVPLSIGSYYYNWHEPLPTYSAVLHFSK